MLSNYYAVAGEVACGIATLCDPGHLECNVTLRTRERIFTNDSRLWTVCVHDSGQKVSGKA